MTNKQYVLSIYPHAEVCKLAYYDLYAIEEYVDSVELLSTYLCDEESAWEDAVTKIQKAMIDKLES